MSHIDDAGGTEIPPTIYSIWLQGVGNAPAIVRLNFERWASLNPGYRLEVLDAAAVSGLFAHLPLAPDEFPPQALSDIVRAYLLAKNGGVWVDASVFPMEPLDEWLPSLMTASGFFAFERPAPDRPISSWFLAANSGNRMMRAWSDQVLKYWSVRRALVEGIPDDPVEAVTAWSDTYPYFWFHYLFQLLVEEDPVFAADWAQCAKVSADLPHLMQGRLGQDPQLPFDELKAIASMAPVHKLNWRVDYPIEQLSDLG